MAAESDRIAVVSLETGERRILVNGQSPRVAASGHLVFTREGVVRAAAFDLDRREVTGEAVPLLENVHVADTLKAAHLAMAANGSLVVIISACCRSRGSPRPMSCSRPSSLSGIPHSRPTVRWVAYQSNASGQWEIYVGPFPDVGSRRVTVSTDGGQQPQWASDGRELFYWSPAGLMAVPVETEPAFTRGDPSVLFALEDYVIDFGRNYAVAPDGQRFLMVKSAQDADPEMIWVQHWFSELERLVQVD